MTPRHSRFLLVAAAGLLLLTGCTSGPTPGAIATHPATDVAGLPKGVQQATAVPTSVPNTPELRKNVTLAACEKADGGWQASGTATNPGGDPADYTVTVFFTTDKGTVLGTADTKVTVAPGEKKPWTVAAHLTPAPTTRCVLRGVG
jgi:uncharacterized lipoprotein YajG